MWEKIGKVANWAKLAVPSHSEPLGGKRLEKLRIRQNWPLRVILSHFSGKRLESCKSDKIGRSKSFWPLQWEKIGKVENWTKLAILSHSEPLRWEKIGKVANWAKLAILSHSGLLWWEKIGKVANWTKLAVLSHSEPLGGKGLEKLQIGQNWLFLSHSEPLWWEKIGKVANQAKLTILSHSILLQWERWKSSE